MRWFLLQVRQLLKLQEQFEISEAARQAQHVGNAGVIADLTATNHQLQAQVTSLTRQLEQTQTKQHRAEDLKAAQQARRAAADAASTEDIANLTQVNGQLMDQVSQLSSQLEQTQASLQDASSAKHAELVDVDRSFSHDDHLQLQGQVSSLAQQLEQAQHELHLTQTHSIAQREDVGGNNASTQVSGDLSEQTSSLSRQLEQTQHELHHVQDFSAAQHAQQAADSTEDITDLTAANGRLLGQVAESQAQAACAQREAEAAAKQLQHMRELVKAQHAKREEHAASLQAKFENLQGECEAKDKQVRLLLQCSMACIGFWAIAFPVLLETSILLCMLVFAWLWQPKAQHLLRCLTCIGSMKVAMQSFLCCLIAVVAMPEKLH